MRHHLGKKSYAIWLRLLIDDLCTLGHQSGHGFALLAGHGLTELRADVVQALNVTLRLFEMGLDGLAQFVAAGCVSPSSSRVVVGLIVNGAGALDALIEPQTRGLQFFSTDGLRVGATLGGNTFPRDDIPIILKKLTRKKPRQ